MLQLDPRIRRRETPLHPGAPRVAVGVPCGGLATERLLIRDALRQALPRQDRQFDLGHVQPTAVLGRVVDLQAGGDPSRLLGREGLVERSQGVDVQVVQHQHDPLCLGVVHLDQLSDQFGPVVASAPLGHLHPSPPRERLEEDEEVGRAAPDVLIVLAGGLARFHWQRFSSMAVEFFALLVQADLGPLRVVRAMVDFEHVFHFGDKLAALFGRNAPLALQPRLEFPLLSTWRTVSYESWSTCPSSTIRSANRRRVQRSRPSGATLQARAMRCASFAPSSLRAFLRACSFRWRARSRPPSTKRLRTRVTVSSVTSSALAMAAFVQSGPASLSSAFSKIRAQVRLRAGARPLLMRRESAARSASLSVTEYFLRTNRLLGRPAHLAARRIPYPILATLMDY